MTISHRRPRHLDISSSFLQNSIPRFRISNLSPPFGGISFGFSREETDLRAKGFEPKYLYRVFVRWALLSHSLIPAILPLMSTWRAVSGDGPGVTLSLVKMLLNDWHASFPNSRSFFPLPRLSIFPSCPVVTLQGLP